MKSTSTAIWKGSVREGSGIINSKTGFFRNLPYSWGSRFEGDQKGTTPEELIAAAHAACFSMAFSSELVKEGFTAESIETSSTVTIENGEISDSHLVVKANVPKAKREIIEQCANNAKANCPVSKVLKLNISMEITSDVASHAHM